MAFWSTAGVNPLRKYRFKIQGLLTEMWLVQSVTMPSFEVTQNSYQILNHQTKIAGILTWSDITVTTVADSKTIGQLTNLMKNNGQHFKPDDPANKGIENVFEGTLKTKIKIDMLDNTGKKSVNSFEITNWFISGINYGEVDYSTDELFTIEVSIAYEYCNIK